MPVRPDGAGAQHSAVGKSMVCPAEGLRQQMGRRADGRATKLSTMINRVKIFSC